MIVRVAPGPLVPFDHLEIGGEVISSAKLAMAYRRRYDREPGDWRRWWAHMLSPEDLRTSLCGHELAPQGEAWLVPFAIPAGFDVMRLCHRCIDGALA